MIEPLQSDAALLADIERHRADPEHFHLWWLGQSGFLLTWQGAGLLLDPYLSDSLTRKYAATDKPHERMTRRVVDPAMLTGIQVITSSHNHTDHLDAETICPLLNGNPQATIVLPEANREFAAKRLGVPPSRLTPVNAGQGLDACGFRIDAIPAAHETLERDEAGRCSHLGFVVRCGPWTIYHSGDTVVFPGMIDWLSDFQIDLALLPINGRLPERRVSGNMWGQEAAQLARDVHARLVVPCHFEMFQFNTVTPEAFTSACDRLNQPYRVLRCGERISSGQT